MEEMTVDGVNQLPVIDAANGELAGTQGEIVWNGFDDNKQRARIGVYVVFLEATDRSSSKVITAKAVAVVATKL